MSVRMSVWRPVRKTVPAAALALLLIAVALPARAQEGAPELFVVHQETIRPPQMDAYLATAKAFAAGVAQHRDVMKTFHSMAFQTDEMKMVYIVPISSFADMDRVMGEFMAMEKAGGDAWSKLMKDNGAAMQQVDEWVVMRIADASFQPAEPTVDPMTAPVFRWDFYDLQPGMEQEALGIARDVKALYEQHDLHDAWDVYLSVLGGGMPFLVVGSAGTSPADLETREAAARAAIGDAWGTIEQRIQHVVRGTRTEYAWRRADLSIAAPQGAGM